MGVGSAGADPEAEESDENPKKAQPAPAAQYNFTDPETRRMKVANKGFEQCANAPAVVDGGASGDRGVRGDGRGQQGRGALVVVHPVVKRELQHCASN